MILQLILSPLFLLISGLLGLLPETFSLPNWLDPCLDLIQTALWFFPADVWAVVIGNIVFWMFVELSWAFVEWVYLKIPLIGG